MIRKLVQAFSAETDGTDDPAALRAEIERLQSQNEKLKRAMRHCIDCEYRIDVMAARADEGRAAGG